MQIAQNSKTDYQEAPPERLLLGTAFTLPPLDIHWERPTDSRPEADAEIRIAFDGNKETFLAEYKPAWNRRTFEAAVAAAARRVDVSANSGPHPLVILPYLSEEHLLELAHRRVSGLDLCGNGVVIVSGRWFIQRSGQPNRFRIPQELRNPYKGLASLVARTLLRKPVFPKLEDIHAEILRRGGQVSLALVSRAMKRLEEEVLVQATPDTRVRLVQPERLLDRFVERAESSRVRQKWKGRVALPTTEFLPQLFATAQAQGVRAAMTGLGSASHHAAVSMEDVAYVYAEDIDTLLEHLPVKPGERFANLEIQTPWEEAVYFDTDQDEQNILWASPVQTYLEMRHSTDARLHEAATSLRTSLLSALQPHKEGEPCR